MIGDLTAGIAVEYPGADTEGMTTPLKVAITEKIGHHTLIESEHLGAPDYFWRSLHTGSPVMVTTASRFGKKTWPGYVTDPRPVHVGEATVPATRVQALGVTYPAKQTSTRVFADKTIEEYIADIAYGLGLVPYVEKTGIYQTVPQAGRSDWTLLRDLAALADLHLFTTGTTLNALTTKGSLGAYYQEAPTLRYFPTDSRDQWPDALVALEYGRRDLERGQVVSRAVDPITARVMSAVSGDGVFAEYGTDLTARSLPTLKAKTDGRAQTGKYAFTARVKGPGNILVSAGKPVYVNDRGDGKWWLVTEVKHEFSTALGDFTTTAYLWRDSAMPTSPRAPRAPGRSTVRTLSRFCLCKEYDPVLVNPSKASYVTRQIETKQGPTAEVLDVRRWRAQGRCDWL